MQMCRDERKNSGNQKICSPYQLAFKAPLPGEPALSLELILMHPGTSCGGLAPETAAWSKLPWRTLGRGVCVFHYLPIIDKRKWSRDIFFDMVVLLY